MQMSGNLSLLRQKLWRAYAALARTLRQLQRAQPMVQGSFYLLRRKCGKPNCHCASGDGHPSLYLVDSLTGKVRQTCVRKALQDPVRQAVEAYEEIRRLIDEVSELEWKRLLARKG